jgi:glutamate-1-semialdehyde 2,1-aminomutase
VSRSIMHAAGPRSRAAFARALSLIPGGVNSPARAFGAVGGTPLFIQRAAGPTLWDIDGHEYLDYIGSWGPMILGHAHPVVCEAIVRAVANGTSYGAPTEAESGLAEQIMQAVPSIQKVRLVSSGTEATMSAIRVARGFTGRHKIIKFAGNYHGHADSLLVAAGSSAATLGAPDSPGVTPGAAQDTIVLQYNDLPSVRETIATQGAAIAAVILEPVVGNMGLVPPQPGFLEGLRALCTESGSVLIFDEVMTGFRLSAGGAQTLLGIDPDMTTLGKIVGGGLPLGAYGGKAEIMNAVLPAGKVFQAGTLSGNPIAVAAGSATLRLLREDPPYARLEQRGARLEAGLRKALHDRGIAGCVQRVGSMLTLFFHPGPIVDWPSADRCDRRRFGDYFWGLIERGVYMPCSQFEALFISDQHSLEQIDQTIAAADEVLGLIADTA